MLVSFTVLILSLAIATNKLYLIEHFVKVSVSFLTFKWSLAHFTVLYTAFLDTISIVDLLASSTLHCWVFWHNTLTHRTHKRIDKLPLIWYSVRFCQSIATQLIFHQIVNDDFLDFNYSSFGLSFGVLIQPWVIRSLNLIISDHWGTWLGLDHRICKRWAANPRMLILVRTWLFRTHVLVISNR